jgi:DNA-directed RNA polymerase specialized sigma24 family protein
MDPRREQVPAQVPISAPLNEAFEAALRGDREALASLLTILKTRYGQSVFSLLRSRRDSARPAVLEDAGRTSVGEFLQEIQGGALRDLPEPERRDVVQFFSGLCERALDKRRKDSSPARPRTEGPRGSLDPKRGPGSPEPRRNFLGRDEHWKLLQGEIGALDAFDRLVLERYLAGVSYDDMARETGRKSAALEIHVTRIKQRIADRIAVQNPPADGPSEREKLPAKEVSCAPRKQEILSALEELPVEAQAAIDFVHVKGRSIVALAKTLGDHGLEKAQARLELGYESLTRKLDIPFPESFEFLKL